MLRVVCGVMCGGVAYVHKLAIFSSAPKRERERVNHTILHTCLAPVSHSWRQPVFYSTPNVSVWVVKGQLAHACLDNVCQGDTDEGWPTAEVETSPLGVEWKNRSDVTHPRNEHCLHPAFVSNCTSLTRLLVIFPVLFGVVAETRKRT